MKASILEQYTKGQEHIGQNSMQILRKFLEYSSMCTDPENIFAYMQQKSICVYLAHYWVAKAQQSASTGDYRGAFECLSQGQSRSDIITEDQINFKLTKKKFFQRLIALMKKYHVVSRKRTAEEYELLSGDRIADEEQIQKALRIYDTGYALLKEQLQNQWKKKNQETGKVKSWMFNLFEERQEKIRKIEERMSIRPSTSSVKEAERHKSMTTPFKRRGLAKLNKTVDSVELLRKKKRITGELTDSKDKSNDCESDQQQEQFSLSRKYHSVPLAKSFSTAKRVTFKGSNKKTNDILGEPRQRSNQYPSCLRHSSKSEMLDQGEKAKSQNGDNSFQAEN